MQRINRIIAGKVGLRTYSHRATGCESESHDSAGVFKFVCVCVLDRIASYDGQKAVLVGQSYSYQNNYINTTIPADRNRGIHESDADSVEHSQVGQPAWYHVYS